MATVQESAAEVRDRVYDGFISYSHSADDLLAPRLQAGLQKFAKPWWKRRAVRIFRDESSLAANPHLWSSITEALESSGWFVLLLSPDAAHSEWVGKEIEHWKATKPADRILPVVTDGEFGWSDGEVAGSSVPEALRGVFTEEPRWVDLRFARNEEHLDLQNPTFSAAIADIASAIRGVPKDELESEEVRQHRRTVRTAWAAVGLVAVLAIAAVGFGIQSARNAAEAQRQAGVAAAQTEIAQANAEAEALARRTADANAAEAELQARIAKSRELSAASIGLLRTDPELAVLLGLEAVRAAPDSDAPPPVARIALRQAVQSSYLVARYPIDLVDGEVFSADLAPSHDAVVLAEHQTLHLVDLADGRSRWTASIADLVTPEGAAGLTCFGEAYFTPDGSRLIVGLIDTSVVQCGDSVPDGHVPRSGIAAFDVATGQRTTTHWLSECGDQILGPMSPTDPIVPVVMPADGNCDPGTPLDWTISLFDAETLEELRTIPVPDIGMISWSADGQRISIGAFFGWGAVVYDSADGTVVSEIPDGVFFGFLSPDGAMIATTDLRSAVYVFDVESGQILDRLTDLGDGAVDVGWSDDGGRLFATGSGSETVIWDAATGKVHQLLPNTGSGSRVLLDDARDRLIHVGLDSVSLWDVSGSVEGSSNTASMDALIQANGVSGVAGEAAAGTFVFLAADGWHVGTFNTSTGLLGDASKPTAMSRRTAVLDDGRVLVLERDLEETVRGPLVAWDPATDQTSVVWGCAALEAELTRVELASFGRHVFTGPCVDGSGDFFDVDRVLRSADGTTLVMNSRDGQLLFFDPGTLELVDTMALPEDAATIREVGRNWIATSNVPTGVVTPLRAISLYSLPEMEPLMTIPGTWAQSSPSGDLVAIDEGPGHVSVWDTSTGGKFVELRGGSARVRGLAFSPDGTLLMTSATDGFMRIWDVRSGTELERIPVGAGQDASGDGYWLDHDTIVIALFDGTWTNIDIGLEALLKLARSWVLRTFTEAECNEYQIDECPTIAQLRDE